VKEGKKVITNCPVNRHMPVCLETLALEDWTSVELGMWKEVNDLVTGSPKKD
jgi:hypothetical protein